MPIDELILEPECGDWPRLTVHAPSGMVRGLALAEWRRLTRTELGLDADRPLIATGHQTMLWHPGILAKYLTVDALAARHGWARANLIVDQHIGRWGDVEFPARSAAGGLVVGMVRLAETRPEVPMALHPASTPQRMSGGLVAALPCVAEGLERIIGAVEACRSAPNAALQMAEALSMLMRRWVGGIPPFTATDLMNTALARSLLQAMAEEPHRAIAAYNAAVAAVPEAGVAELLVRDDVVELPIWRIRSDGRRMRGYDGDAQAWLGANTGVHRSATQHSRRSPGSPGAGVDAENAKPFRLFPRAIYMTALIRLGVCDLFVHGTGGARYDAIMERWIESWLGVRVAPISIASATVRLPLASGAGTMALEEARAALRHRRHDPFAEDLFLSAQKRQLVNAVTAAPRGSAQRRAAFLELHRAIDRGRIESPSAEQAAQARFERALRQAVERPIAERRTWAFPLYPETLIDELAERIRARSSAAPGASHSGSSTSIRR
jgi:hypothetical protein